MTEPLEVQYRTREEGQEEGIYPLENDRRTRRYVSTLEELCFLSSGRCNLSRVTSRSLRGGPPRGAPYGKCPVNYELRMAHAGQQVGRERDDEEVEAEEVTRSREFA